MDRILHVVNGDTTAEILQQTNLNGEVIVWREMLCEGTLDKVVGSDDFWKNRYNYFEQNFEVGKLEYFDKTIKEIIKLDYVGGIDEVVLWFEFDLFCQVNLMAVCSYLLQSFRKDVKYSLVCVGFKNGKERLQSLADYTPEEFPKLLENKLNISKSNLEFADEIWKVYVRNNKEEIQNYKFKHSKFKYLKMAMEQHLKRFPFANGLNEIENKILQIIYENSLTKREIVKELLIWQTTETVYGFGDLQYFKYLESLGKYFVVENEIYQLNKLGKSKLK